MSLSYVLCPVTGGSEDGAALRMALQVAGGFDAHVRALFVRSSVAAAIPYLGEGLTGAVVENIVATAAKASDESLVAVNQHVLRALADTKVTEGSLSVRVTEGVVEDEVAAASRLADLVVYARDPADSAFPDRSLAEHTLLGARRPILIAPPGAYATIGTKVAVLWDGGTSAASAFIAALPFLKRAQAVTVVHMADDNEELGFCEDIRDSLSIRGIQAQMLTIDKVRSGNGAHLMEAALGAEADLLVMGGYSHSRLRQLVLGGATRWMLKNASLPVLMAH